MDFYVLFSVVAQLLTHRQWKLQRCRRQSDDEMRYYVTDTGNRVLTPKTQCRAGLTLLEILSWMEECGDTTLSDGVRSFRNQAEYVW